MNLKVFSSVDASQSIEKLRNLATQSANLPLRNAVNVTGAGISLSDVKQLSFDLHQSTVKIPKKLESAAI
jgi:hypothetical protein